MMKYIILFILATYVLNSCVNAQSSLPSLRKYNGRATLPRKISLVSKIDKLETKTIYGTSTLSTSIFNLAKTVLGAGVLSLPFGVASYSDIKSSLIPASILLIVMGIVSAYSFYSIGRACNYHNATSFPEAWSKSVSPRTAKLVSAVVTLKTFFACLPYLIIIGDSFSSIFKSLGLPAAMTQRSAVIVGFTTFVIFPLCCLRQLDALKYTSILGLLGVLYCALFLGMRYFDGSYRSGGHFYSMIDPLSRPSFNERSISSVFPMIFILISMISTAYVAHYNSPKFWTELKDPTLPRFKTVVSIAFGTSILLYIVVMILGFCTFGGNSAGFILNNYASSDQLATLARVAIAIGIICSYPLAFAGLRDGTFDLMNIPREKREKYFYPVTTVLLIVLMMGSLVLKNVGKVVSFSGALIGSLIIYVIPSIMTIGNIYRENQSKPIQSLTKKASYTLGQQIEVSINMFMIVLGIVMGIIGVAVNFIGQIPGH